MGFITRAFSVLAGSEEFPIGSSESLILQRSSTLLTKSVRCIIDANQGWQLDLNRNTTDTDYVNIPSRGSSSPFPGLFLINNISGCKLFIAYFGNSPSLTIKNYNNGIALVNNSTEHTGLLFSMIPGESSSEFGDPNSDSFIPNDATRIVGGCPIINGSAAANPSSGYGYAYNFGITPYCIYWSHVYATSSIANPYFQLYCPTLAVGRIFESCLHEEQHINSKYGAIYFRDIPNSRESYAAIHKQEILIYTGNSFIGNGVGQLQQSSTTYGTRGTGCSIAKENGEWIGCSDYSNYRVIHYLLNPNVLMFNLSSTEKYWSAFGVGIYSNNVNNYNVSQGNCFKGILDTSLFRGIANGTRGQSFDNGNFLCPEDNCGLLLGWDVSNEPIL